MAGFASAWSSVLTTRRLARVLINDPGISMIRHVDAEYDRTVRVVGVRGVRNPMWGNA